MARAFCVYQGGAAAYRQFMTRMRGEAASERVAPPERVSLLMLPYSVSTGR